MSDSLIVRLPNWLGDTVMAVPTLRALRAGLPGARVVAAGPWAPLLEGQGLADVLVTYSRSWSGRLRRADAVRGLGATTAVLLPGSFEAAASAWYWGARRRLGFDVGGRGWLLTDRVELPSPRAHQVDEYLLLAERAGAPPVTRDPSLEPPAPGAVARLRVRELLTQAGVPVVASNSRRLIGIHLGAEFGPSKLWPVDRIAGFCRLLRQAGDVPVLLGAPAALPLAARILELASAASLVGRDAPNLMTAVATSIDGLVCGDTGVGHLAAALGTPVVALFGPTDPRLTAPRGRVEVLTHPTPCAPCFYRACPIDHPCMAGISPVDVHERLGRLLATPPAGVRG